MIMEHLTVDWAEVQVPELFVMAHCTADICVFWELNGQTWNPVLPADRLLPVFSQAQTIKPFNPDVPCGTACLHQVARLQVLQDHLGRLWHLGVLHKWEGLSFFIRALWALLQHLAVGHVAQRVTNVPVLGNKVSFNTKSTI